MPRLTRTQKFAELREQLANDKEEKISSQVLSSYKNRFINADDIVASYKETVIENPAIEEVQFEEVPVAEENTIEDTNEIWVPFVDENKYAEPVIETKRFEEAKNVVEEIPEINNLFVEQPVAETAVVEENVEVQPVVEQFEDEDEQQGYEQATYVEVPITTEIPMADEYVEEEPIQDTITSELHDEFNSGSSEDYTTSEYVWTPYTEQENSNLDMSLTEEFGSIKDELDADTDVEVIKEEVEQNTNEIVYEEKAVEEISVEDLLKEVKVDNVDSSFEENETKISYFDNFVGTETDNSQDNQNIDTNAEEENKRVSIDEIYGGVFTDVNDESGRIVSLKERNTYLNQTMSDVKFYNEINGEKSIENLLDDSVDEVRHPEGKVEVVEQPFVEETIKETASIEDTPVEEPIVVETPVVEEVVEEPIVIEQPVFEEVVIPQQPAETVIKETPVLEQSISDIEKVFDTVEEEIDLTKINPIDDQEFTNTVTVEISKIMASLADKQGEEVDVVADKHIELIDEDEENPEDVVEIKNIAELTAEMNRGTITTTKPFVIETDEAEDEEDDGDSDSNTVLNVILIVLIVVLIAVLGLIVFYILKAKEIL